MSTDTPQHSVAYLGPRGSFAEAAVLAWPGSADAELLPSTSVPAALEAVRGDAVDHALVPIENSVEGSVSATLDELGSENESRCTARFSPDSRVRVGEHTQVNVATEKMHFFDMATHLAIRS